MPTANVDVSRTETPPHTVAELIKEAQLHPVRWLIPGMMMEGGVHVLHGREETFKTMLSLQMAEVLTCGGEILGRKVEGGLRIGFVELEQTPRLFGSRLARFFKNGAPPIYILPTDLRTKVLTASTPRDRIKVLFDWAKREKLDVVMIDSAVKLFPPKWRPDAQELASEVFNLLQQLPTPWIIAHDRKSSGEFTPTPGSNEEIIGSQRFAADADVIHQLVRPDARSPKAIFYWGKMREGEKDAPVEFYFDRVNFRLCPLHPFIHLLRDGPKSEEELVAEAESRYGWKERRAREYIASLVRLTDSNGHPAVAQKLDGHKKMLDLVAEPVPVTEDEFQADNSDPLDTFPSNSLRH